MKLVRSVRMAAVTLVAIAGAGQIASAAESTSGQQPAASSWEAQLNTQMKRVIDVYQLIAGTPITSLNPQDARQQFAAEDAAKIIARADGAAPAPQPVAKIVDGMSIPGPGGDLPIRIYKPASNTPLPVIVYFHGGGFVIATIDTYDASARALANEAHAIVVSVEYRKGPEHPFPAALEDAIATYKWTLGNAGTFGGDASKVAVAGESAGGNLAAEICLQAHEQGLRMPIRQVLIYPVTDFSTDYPSDTTYADAQPLNTPALLWFTKYYLSNPSEATDPRASPIHGYLHGMPPATIIAAQIDPLVDEGYAYAQKLKAAGVSVNYKLYKGVTHEFFGMGAVLKDAQDAEAAASADLRQSFSH